MPSAVLPPGPRGHFITGNLVEFPESTARTSSRRSYEETAPEGARAWLATAERLPDP